MKFAKVKGREIKLQLVNGPFYDAIKNLDVSKGYEPAVTELLIPLLCESRCFVDVGAHIGYFSCIAGIFNPRLQGYAFEMNKELFSELTANLN